MKLPVINPIIRLILKILSVVLFFVTLVSAFGGKVNPQYLTFPAVATLILPYFAIATAIVTLAWLLSGRFIIGALGVLTLIAGWGPISSAVPLKFSKSADNEAETFSLLTYNILHGDDYRNPDSPGNRSFEFVINSGADIVCLQELRRFSKTEIKNFTPELKQKLSEAYPYQAGDGMTDLKVLSKYPVELIKMDSYPRTRQEDSFTRADFFKLKIKGRVLNLVNMHMNSYELTEDERDVVTEIRSVNTAKKSIKEMKGSIWQKMSRNFKERAVNARKLKEAINDIKGPLIVCGDFNDVPASYAYRIMMGDDMHDAFAETHFGPTFTYNAHMFLFHLDQIFYRGDLKALSVKREKINSSDHYPLFARFEFTDEKTN